MIDREPFDRYDRALSTNAELVAAAVTELAGELDRLSWDEVASALESRYRALVTEYGTYAAAVAVEFYTQQREASQPTTSYEAVQFYPKDWALLADDVRSEAVRGREVAAVLRSLAGRSQQRVMAYADETIDRNATLDPAHPKWAIVPHVGACGFCLMLGANGFVYGSEAKADASRHPSCKCTPAVDFDSSNPFLDGYRPAELQNVYAASRRIVEDDARAEWDAMSAEERSRYSRNGRASYDAYLRGRIAGTMGKWHGVDARAISGKQFRKLKDEKPLEWAGYTRMAELGLMPRLLYEDRGANANFDCTLGREDMDGYWDLKTISGGMGAIKKRMAECHSKWARLTAPGVKAQSGVDLAHLGDAQAVVDNRWGKSSDEAAMSQVASSMRYLSGRGGIKFSRAIFIKSDGTAVLIENGSSRP